MSTVPTRISDCDSHSTALRNFLFLLTLVFALHWPSLRWETLPPLGNVVSATNCFPSKRKESTPFHHTAFYYSCVNWNGLSDHLIDALFSLYQQSKSFESKVNFKQAKFLEAAKLAYYNKTKDSNTFQKLGSRNHWEIPNSVFNKGKPAIPPLKKIV